MNREKSELKLLRTVTHGCSALPKDAWKARFEGVGEEAESKAEREEGGSGGDVRKIQEGREENTR